MPRIREQPTRSNPLRWKWIVAGVVLGTLLITSFVSVVIRDAANLQAGILVGCLTFALTGLLVGYNSPGSTIREAGVAGVILAVTASVILWLSGAGLSPGVVAAEILIGTGFASIGGWVGEVMQGTIHEGRERGRLKWPWVVVGITIGLLLTTYGVFVGHALFNLQPWQVLATYAVSFLVTGFFVGIFSPGVTIVEPALAGGGLVVMDAVMAAIGFGAPFPAASIGVGILGGLLLALLGGWAGETAQRLRAAVPSPG